MKCLACNQKHINPYYEEFCGEDCFSYHFWWCYNLNDLNRISLHLLKHKYNILLNVDTTHQNILIKLENIIKKKQFEEKINKVLNE